jgi:nucleoside-diphosphate-sugar epimerase
MGRTIAITGATGFAGRQAVAELLAHGHRLKALVRKPENAGLDPAVELVKGDVSDAAALARLTDGADAIVHLAGALAAADRSGYFSVNEGGTRALLAAAEAAGTGRFVHISSLAAREPQYSHYGASKRAGEEAVKSTAAARNAIIIRPPAVYGPGDKGTLPLIRELTKPVAAIPARRDARFSLIHVRDLARIIAKAVASDLGGLHEVSDGRAGGYDWEALIAIASAEEGRRIRPVFLPRAIPLAVALGAETLSRVTGKPGLVNRGKIAELYHTDWVSREGTLGLADPISFREGFAETVQWYRMAGWLPRPRSADRRPGNS